MPPGLIGIAGSNCLSLDLSYNELSSLLAVKDFVNLEELILDNNSLRDLNSLPKLPKLKTLSLNNNKVKTCRFVVFFIRILTQFFGKKMKSRLALNAK